MSLDYKKSVSKAIFAVGLTAPKEFIEAKVIFIKTINKTWSMSFSSNDIMTKKNMSWSESNVFDSQEFDSLPLKLHVILTK